VNPGDIFNHRFHGRVAAKVRYNRVVMPVDFSSRGESLPV
jgi:hypothetical protein